jgi:hypothetical protein
LVPYKLEVFNAVKNPKADFLRTKATNFEKRAYVKEKRDDPYSRKEAPSDRPLFSIPTISIT